MFRDGFKSCRHWDMKFHQDDLGLEGDTGTSLRSPKVFERLVSTTRLSFQFYDADACGVVFADTSSNDCSHYNSSTSD